MRELRSKVLCVDTTDYYHPTLRLAGFLIVFACLLTPSILAAQSWEFLTTPTIGDIYAMDFEDSRQGALCFRYFHATDDGGKTWNTNFNLAQFLANDMARSGDTIVLVGSSQTIYTSYDNGQNWTRRLGDSTNPFNPTFVTHAGGSTYYTGGDQYNGSVYVSAIRRTTDAGRTWDTVSSITQEQVLWDVEFLTPSTGLACGANGRVLRTVDAGKSWRQVLDLANSIYDIERVSNDSCYLITETGQPYFSEDAGASWVMRSNCGFEARAISFENAQHGFATGSGVAETTDGGMSWQQILPSGRRIKRMQYFPAERTLIVAGGEGLFGVYKEQSNVDPRPNGSYSIWVTTLLGSTSWELQVLPGSTPEKSIRELGAGVYLWHTSESRTAGKVCVTGK